MKKPILIAASAIALFILLLFWSNHRIEKQRHRMRTLKAGMSRAEVENLLSTPDTVINGPSYYSDSPREDSCLTLLYYGPVMAVTICHDSATSAYFYKGKSEQPIFE